MLILKIGLSNDISRLSPRRKRRKVVDIAEKKWGKLLALPNVYVDLYITNNTREYVMTMNCSVLARELKHKLVPY